MQKAFVTLASGRQVHYRTAGVGPPLIMLHQSPQHSETLEPAMHVFSSVCQCIALDTPGYGLSDDFSEPAGGLEDYAAGVIEALDAMGIGEFYLYGVATGAQIGIEVAKQNPDRVRFLLLDANGHVSPEERDEILDGYFPDVSPQPDGGHLLTYWDMCRQLFVAFPWHSGKLQDGLHLDQPSPDVIQTILMRYLEAGEQYHHAYRLAFYTENRAHMDGLSVPTTMVRWEGSAALGMTDALIELGVPECVTVLDAGPDLENRFAIQLAALQKAVSGGMVSTVELRTSLPETCDRFTKTYFKSGSIQIHGRINKKGRGKPLVILHDAASSSSGIVTQVDKLAEQRPILLLDLPNHGDSDDLPADETFDFGSIANAVADALRAAGFEDAEIAGIGLGGAIALTMSTIMDLQHIYVINPVAHDRKPQEAAEKLPDLSPTMDGTHLIKAWVMLRDAELYWPWFDTSAKARRQVDADVCPGNLHQKTVNLFKTGSSFAATKSLEYDLDWSPVLRGTKTPVTLVYTVDQPNPDHAGKLAESTGTQLIETGRRISQVFDVLATRPSGTDRYSK